MKPFRIPSSPEIEKALLEKFKEKRTKKKASDPLAKASPHLSRLEWIRFQVLHRQFSKGYFPGLPTTIKTAHRLYKALGLKNGNS